MTRLVILWLLSEHPLHGYRIKRILDDNSLRFWFPIETGSIYAMLRSLERGGFIEAEVVEREGQRPERTRFRITKSGRHHFQELLRQAWREPARPSDAIDLAFAARSELEEDEAEWLLSERASALRERLEELARIVSSAPAPEMVDRMRILTQAELSWVETLLEKERRKRGDNDMDAVRPEIQLISNVVVTNEDGKVLFVKHDPEDDRWWLPGGDLLPFQHPDDRARETLGGFPGLVWQDLRLVSVESFRGRRGWHVMFDYHATGSGIMVSTLPASWFSPDDLPRTMHGQHERETVLLVLASARI